MLYQTFFVLTVRITLYLIRHDQLFQHISVRSKPTELLAHCSLLAYSKCGLISDLHALSLSICGQFLSYTLSRKSGDTHFLLFNLFVCTPIYLFRGWTGMTLVVVIISLDSLNFYGKFSLFLFIFIFSFS